MSKLTRAVGVAAMASVLLAGAALAAEMVQENRTKTMKQMGANLGALGKVAKGEMAYSMDNVANAEAIVQLSKGLLVLFPPGSGGGESRALPAIWESWSDFESKVKALQDAAPGLVAAAKTGDKDKIGAAVGEVGKTCGGCHKPFRAEKKS